MRTNKDHFASILLTITSIAMAGLLTFQIAVSLAPPII